MAEEFRIFLRTGLYIAGAGLVYWLVSYEAAGTVLLVALLLAIVAFLAVGVAFAGGGMADDETRIGILGRVNRVIGFHERPDATAPLEGGPELIPLSSAWPVVTAAAMVVIGLGLIFGAWLTIPGVALLAMGGLGWLTQLDDAG